MLTAASIARVVAHRNVRAPIASSATHYALVELEDAPRDALEEWVQSLVARGAVVDGVLAQNSAEGRDLWTLRESIGETLAATGYPHKNDVALPVAALEAFCAELDEVFARRYPGWEVFVFGHIGDGNLHVNVMEPAGMDHALFLEKTREADEALFGLVRKHGGSISAEHGIGLIKKDWLGWSRSDEELRAMRAIKGALDPKGILNPGKIFDL
jgi:FAD/FMN-containing dehydrogenase